MKNRRVLFCGYGRMCSEERIDLYRNTNIN